MDDATRPGRSVVGRQRGFLSLGLGLAMVLVMALCLGAMWLGGHMMMGHGDHGKQKKEGTGHEHGSGEAPPPAAPEQRQ